MTTMGITVTTLAEEKRTSGISLTKKIVLVITTMVTISWLVATSVAMMVMQDELSEVFDRGVKETAERLLPLVLDDLEKASTELEPRGLSSRSTDGKEYLMYQVRDARGKVLLYSNDTAAVSFGAPLREGFHDTATYRIYTAASSDGRVFVQVADSLGHRWEAIMEGGFVLLMPLLALVPISIIAIIVLVRASLRPLQIVRDQIGQKDGGNMVPIDEAPLYRELQPIVRSVNFLLKRLRSAIDAEREFATNSAHELRTPIAGALAQAEMLRIEAPPGLIPRIARIEQSLTRLASLVEKLLQMARAEAGIGVSETETDLLQVVQIVVSDLGRTMECAGARVVLHVEEGTSLRKRVDVDAFGIAVRNLVHNALVHSEAGSPVDIYVDNVCLRIVNHCPLVDKSMLEKLTTRFIRGETGPAGFGLGLSIVKKIADQMNMGLVLKSPAPGRSEGFEARLNY